MITPQLLQQASQLKTAMQAKAREEAGIEGGEAMPGSEEVETDEDVLALPSALAVAIQVGTMYSIIAMQASRL